MIVLNDLNRSGNLKIYQDTNSFRFSIDSILLSSFITINKRLKNIIDIGTGNGPIALLLSKRCNAKIVGVEIQENSALLANKSIDYNQLNNQISIVNDDIKIIYKNYNNFFDIVVCNPPYFKTNNIQSINKKRNIARNEIFFNLEDLLIISKQILKNNGKLYFVFPTTRFTEVISLMKKYNIEPKRIQFIYPNMSKESIFFLIEGTKNGKEGLHLLSPLFIFDQDNKYTKEILDIYSSFD